MNNIRKKAERMYIEARNLMTSTKGDVSINFIGGMILACIVVGVLITGATAFLGDGTSDGFIFDLFTKVQQALADNF